MVLLTSSSSRRATAALAAVSAAVLAGSVLSGASASTGSARVTDWAPAATATITPGVQTYTDGGSCTGNFIFTDDTGNVYVGFAAHCASAGGDATDTNGCATKALPLGTPVKFYQGGNLADPGTLVGNGALAYSSWHTEDEIGTMDPNTCAYNDFALVKIDASDVADVNPSVPFWGGPTGIDTDGTATGDRVYTYGNSILRAGVGLLSPHTGISLGDSAADEGWSHPLYTVSPGIPGDSGSAFLSEGGAAIGTLSTLGLAPLPLSNNIADLSHTLAFAQQHSGISGLELVNGTEVFDPIL